MTSAESSPRLDTARAHTAVFQRDAPGHRFDAPAPEGLLRRRAARARERRRRRGRLRDKATLPRRRWAPAPGVLGLPLLAGGRSVVAAAQRPEAPLARGLVERVLQPSA